MCDIITPWMSFAALLFCKLDSACSVLGIQFGDMFSSRFIPNNVILSTPHLLNGDQFVLFKKIR